MGHLITVERYGQGNHLEEFREFRVSNWVGIWETVEGEMDRTETTPTGMEGWEEGGCVLAQGHDCDDEPERCLQYLKGAIRDWIKSAWANNQLRVGSFCFGGTEWSSVTFGWDGE